MDDVFAPLDAAEIVTPPALPREDWEAITPVPQDAPKRLPGHSLGKPSSKFPYRDAVGRLLFLACRFDLAGGGKTFLPLSYCQHADGRREWQWRGLAAPRPLYGLDRLAARPAAPVIVTEGEKSADAAGMLFPDHVAVTSPNGAKSADKADWGALNGRAVTVWPDNDDEGRVYAEDVARLALAAGAASVAIVPVPSGFPPKWDLADALPHNIDAGELRRLLNEAASATPPELQRVDTWPPLVRLDAPSLPPLPGDVLPGFAGAFAAALAEATETPPALVVGMILATCATATARRFRLLIKPDYFEPLNLWMAVALPPGNRKSAVQSAAAAPLQIWEIEQAVAMRDEIRRCDSERKTQEARIKDLRAKAARAEDNLDAANYARQAAELEADMVEVPRVPQLWTSDATPERLGMILADNRERMAWLSSEGGIFDILGGRYSGGIPNLDLMLKAHSGDAERVDRGSRPVVMLHHPLLSIGLSPQPELLRGLSSKPGFRGRGLLGRFLYLMPPSPLGWRTLDTRPMPSSVAAAYGAGVRAILDMESASDDAGEPIAHILRLTPESFAEWRAFALRVEAEMRAGGTFEMATDWAGKAPGAAARLAGVLHVIEHAHGTPAASPVSVETMGRALEIMALIARHSLHALDLMGADEGMASARRVWDWIERGRHHRFAVSEAYQSLKSAFPRVAGLREAIGLLEERGYLEIRDPPVKGRGRPPSPIVTVRPELVRGW